MNLLDSLRAILPLLQEVSLYNDPERGLRAWTGETPSLRYWLVLSTLAAGDWEDRVEALDAWLAGHRQSDKPGGDPVETIAPAEIPSSLGWSVAESHAALAALATSGLAGFDAADDFYFQRKLPINLARIGKNHPRLHSATKLLQQEVVRLVESLAAEVESGDINYFGRLTASGYTCTCPWYSRHQGDRGPCKHMVAARMLSHREKPS